MRKITLKRRRNPYKKHIRRNPNYSSGLFDIDARKFSSGEKYTEAVVDHVLYKVSLESKLNALLSIPFNEEFDREYKYFVNGKVGSRIKNILFNSEINEEERTEYYEEFMKNFYSKLDINEFIMDIFFYFDRTVLADIVDNPKNLELEIPILNAWYQSFDDRYRENR